MGAMLTRGADHVVTNLNAMLCGLLCGADRADCAEVLGHPLGEVPGSGALVPMLSEVFAQGVVAMAAEQPWDHPRRGRIHLNLLVLPSLDETGATVGLQVFVREATPQVSARARLQEASEQLRTINERLLIAGLREEKLAEEAEERAEERQELLANLTDGVVALSSSGEVTLVNAAARGLLGMAEAPKSLEDLCAWGFRTKDDGALAENSCPWTRVLRGERLHAEEYTVHRPDETRRKVMISGGAVRSETGAVRQAVLVFHDVTRLRHLEHLREEYLALTSHDLRTPLASITFATQVLRRRLAHTDSGTSSLLTRIESNARRMDAMLQDLLETTRLESETFRLQKRVTDLPALVRGVAERIAPERIEVLPGAHSALLEADPERLERVVVNLLSNALKYSPPDSTVAVQVTREKEQLVLAVMDQGVGIPVDELPHLFHRFFRARTGRKREGLGLGLHIARLVVEAHGGRIWAASREGQGSTFFVALPAMPQPGDLQSRGLEAREESRV